MARTWDRETVKNWCLDIASNSMYDTAPSKETCDGVVELLAELARSGRVETVEGPKDG